MNKQHPAYWVLDLIVVLVLGLLLGQAFLPLSEGLHQLVMVAIVLLACGLMWLWVWRNSEAIEREERDKQAASQAERPVLSGRATAHETETAVQSHFRRVMRQREIPRARSSRHS